MQRKAILGQNEVTQLLSAARQAAQDRGLNLTFAVADDGGHLLALERMDNCAPIAASIAAEKARTAALGRRETKDYEDMINNGRYAFLSAPTITASLEGGVPVIIDGHIIGAIGISGARPEIDAEIAKIALKTLL